MSYDPEIYRSIEENMMAEIQKERPWWWLECDLVEFNINFLPKCIISLSFGSCPFDFAFNNDGEYIAIGFLWFHFDILKKSGF